MVTQDIENDQAIIGLMCNTKKSDYITRLGFIMATLPPVELTELVYGGEISDSAWTDQFPSPVVLPHIKYDFGYLLSEIKYMYDTTHFGLTGIQLVFSNGEESPMFES